MSQLAIFGFHHASDRSLFSKLLYRISIRSCKIDNSSLYLNHCVLIFPQKIHSSSPVRFLSRDLRRKLRIWYGSNCGSGGIKIGRRYFASIVEMGNASRRVRSEILCVGRDFYQIETKSAIESVNSCPDVRMNPNLESTSTLYRKKWRDWSGEIFSVSVVTLTYAAHTTLLFEAIFLSRRFLLFHVVKISNGKYFWLAKFNEICEILRPGCQTILDSLFWGVYARCIGLSWPFKISRGRSKSHFCNEILYHGVNVRNKNNVLELHSFCLPTWDVDIQKISAYLSKNLIPNCKIHHSRFCHL